MKDNNGAPSQTDQFHFGNAEECTCTCTDCAKRGVHYCHEEDGSDYGEPCANQDWLERMADDAQRSDEHDSAVCDSRREKINTVVSLLRQGWSEDRIQNQVRLTDEIWQAAIREAGL